MAVVDMTENSLMSDDARKPCCLLHLYDFSFVDWSIGNKGENKPGIRYRKYLLLVYGFP